MPESPDDDSFQFSLGFAGGTCLSCETVTESVSCPACGAEVVPPDGLNEATEIRREVLLPLRVSAEAALAALEDIPAARIPLAPPVLLSGLREADLFSRVIEIAGLGSEMATLDLDDPDVIRGPLLALAEKRLRLLESMVSACLDLNLFRAASPADRLPGLAAEVSGQGGRMLVAYFAALTAVDAPAARDGQAAIQHELNGVGVADELSEVLTDLESVPSGIDERVGIALAREGTFTDGYGAIDLSRVLWAYRGSGDPFRAVGQRAAQYFEPLLSIELDVEDSRAMVLALPLLQLVSADHPLIAHRLARETHELFRAAVEADRGAVDAARRQLETHGDALLTAQEIARVAALEVSTASDAPDDEVLSKLLALYQHAAAGFWQPYVEALARLAEIAGDSDPAALQTLRGAAEAVFCHDVSQFSWEESDGEWLILHGPTGNAWDLDAFASGLDRLLSASAGADAGYCVGLVSEDIVTDNEPVGPQGTAVLVSAVVGPAGVTVLDMASDASSIRVAPIADAPDVQRLLSATAGLAAAFPATQHFSIEDQDGQSIVEMSAATMRAAQEASPALRDLAVVAACHESRVARGEPVAAVTRHLAAVQTYVTAAVGLRDLEDPAFRVATHLQIVKRLGFVGTYARKNGEGKVAARLGRAQASAAMAARGDWSAHLRAVDQLNALAAWAQSAGAALRWL